MSEHVYDRFDRAIARMEDASNMVEEWISQLDRCRRKLDKWKSILIEDNTNLLEKGNRCSLPRVVENLDASEYPKFSDLDAAMDRWHQARSDAQGALQAMTTDQRGKREPELLAKLRSGR